MTTNILAPFSRFAVVCAMFGLAAHLSAAPINYGDFDDIPPGVVTYTDVQEDANSAGDDPPLFGAPDVIVNTIDFDPIGFGASASNGDIDITDGQLNFGFETLPGTGLTSFTFNEGGDYTFLNGGSGTSVSYSVFTRVTVTEVNGVALDPADYIEVDGSDAMLLTAPGGFVPNTAWSLDPLFVDLGPELGMGNVATAGEVFLNNTLIAASESGSLAFLAKKDFWITPGGSLDPDNVIPEPTSAVLAVLAAAGVAARRR